MKRTNLEISPLEKHPTSKKGSLPNHEDFYPVPTKLVLVVTVVVVVVSVVVLLAVVVVTGLARSQSWERKPKTKSRVYLGNPWKHPKRDLGEASKKERPDLRPHLGK